jgi:hypothetical protein
MVEVEVKFGRTQMPKSTECEIRPKGGDDLKWEQVSIKRALKVPRYNADFRCIECGRPVRAHSRSESKRKAAHFQHGEPADFQFDGVPCSRSTTTVVFFSATRANRDTGLCLEEPVTENGVDRSITGLPNVSAAFEDFDAFL